MQKKASIYFIFILTFLIRKEQKEITLSSDEEPSQKSDSQ